MGVTVRGWGFGGEGGWRKDEGGGGRAKGGGVKGDGGWRGRTLSSRFSVFRIRDSGFWAQYPRDSGIEFSGFGSRDEDRVDTRADRVDQAQKAPLGPKPLDFKP